MLFADSAPCEDDARNAVMPAFFEVEPGSFKPVEKCSRGEIESTIMSMTIQAQALLDQAGNLQRYLDEGRPPL